MITTTIPITTTTIPISIITTISTTSIIPPLLSSQCYIPTAYTLLSSDGLFPIYWSDYVHSSQFYYCS